MSKMRKSQAGLTEKRRELFKLLLEERGVESGSLERIPKRRGGEESPLSYAQERLWFLEQLEEGNTAYTIPTVIEMKGELDVGGLERSVNRIIERHETLRTTFRTKQGKPVQVIHAEMPLKVAVEDYRDLPEEEKQKAIEEAVAAYASQPFDLKRGPLIRAKLLRRGPEEQVLIVSMHHIIADGWSIGVLISEMGRAYEAEVKGEALGLAELPIQYGDYAVWQREYLQGEELARQLGYWKEQLKGAPEVMNLGTDRARGAVQSYRGGTQKVEIGEAVKEGLKRIGQEQGATMYMVMMAGMRVLLRRYSGERDLVIGTAIANRRRKEVEGLIGFFVNSLAMRAEVGEEESYEEVLRREKEVAMGGYENQDVPFEKVVEEVKPERSLSYTPLFQVMFVLQNAPITELKLHGLTLKQNKIYNGTSKFDLLLELFETPGGLNGCFEYSTDLFDPETIERMAGHFEVLLESIVADPGQNINDLALLTPAERQQILITWNQTAQPFPRQACIHELFEAQVEISAEAIAVQSGEQALSYRQLNERANQLGHYLRSRGVGAEVRVGICLSRRIEMVVAVLGVLKAGGAYVPLDPEYPAERLAFMVEDSGAWLVISQRQGSARVREWCPEVVEIEEQEEEIGRQSRSKPESGLSSGNLAYVIYTSGSTGRPKGVAIEHRNTVALLAWARANYRQEELRSVVAATSICFDLSVYEMLVPLVVGGKVEVVSSLLEVGEGESGRQGSLLNTVPSGMEELVRRRRVPGSVETVNLAGEALEERLVKAVYEETGVKRVVNLYGPTECTTYSTYEEEEEGEKVSIGRPIWNTRVYVRDGRQGVVAVGVEGEIYIGGEGVARGYMGRAEQTAERFMPEESGGGEGGGRMYRTGDRGRYRRDGKIEYRGRGDEQVKVRGYRIELGEVEAVISEYPAVKQCVVVQGKDDNEKKMLAAYVALDTDCLVNSEDAPVSKLISDQVSQWEVVFDEIYSHKSESEDPDFNIAGWNSSYIGQPLSSAEMQEWVNHTVNRILSLKPNNVVEIGCGSGLLLFRIAPYCLTYCGTDISLKALRYIDQQLMGRDNAQVSLLHRTADDFEMFGENAFDLMIMNSVVQYFPSVEYLLSVLEKSVKAVKPTGHIFIGDLRSLPLMKAFHCSVLLEQASPSVSKAELQRQIERQIAQERELAIAPAFFTALKRYLPKITRAEVHLKRGRHDNELSRFRYDVVLHAGGESDSSLQHDWLDWQEDGLTLDSLRKILLENNPEVLCIRGIPNARVMLYVDALKLLDDRSGPATVGELREALQGFDRDSEVNPEDLWAIGDELSYDVQVSWSGEGSDGRCDAVIKKTNSEVRSHGERSVVDFTSETQRVMEWDKYANNPMQERFAAQFIPKLRNFLQQRLPAYMIPSSFTMLDRLPLTPNGKIDRSALPAPQRVAPSLAENFTPPRTPIEELLADIWSQLLVIEKVGIQQDFFELGGHSLLATQAISLLRESLQFDLPLRVFFENPRIEELANYIEQSIVQEIGALTGEGTSPLPT